MVGSIRIYFEGDRQLRRGFTAFFRAIEPKPKVVAGGSQALQDFFHALRIHPGSFIILLVDAEGPIQEAWNRLGVVAIGKNPLQVKIRSIS